MDFNCDMDDSDLYDEDIEEEKSENECSHNFTVQAVQPVTWEKSAGIFQPTFMNTSLRTGPRTFSGTQRALRNVGLCI